MTTKHTPGPLHVRTSNAWPFDINICNQDGDVVDVIRLPAHSTRHKSFEDALNCKGFEHSEAERCRDANKRALVDAHLRAAAPELLEACMRMIGSLGVMVGDPDNDGDIKFARAAIAKATGEQQ